MTDLNALPTAIIIWAEDKGILTNSDPLHQMVKTYEEVNELCEGVLNSSKDCIEDAIGDVVVTLVIQARMQGLDFATCVDKAYKVIAARTGKMENGLFLKD